MAADILFYSLCEWALYANEKYIDQLGGIQKWASTFPLFHWGPIAWSFYIILAVAFVFAIMVFVPFLRGSRYVYPIQPGQSYPEREFFQTSIFMGTYEHGNPIGLISFFLSLFASVSAALSLVLKKAKYTPILKLGSYVLFFVDIFVSFAAVVCCLSYIS